MKNGESKMYRFQSRRIGFLGRPFWALILLGCGSFGGLFLWNGCDHASRSALAGDNRKQTPKPDDLSAWRSPLHDGVNSLFLFLKLHGVSADYQELRDSLKEKPSIVDLKRRSIAAGFPCAIVKPVMTSVESIKDLQLPAIVLLDSGRGRHSGFHLVYCITEQREVRMASGSELTWNQLTLDDFLRHWTGHMLVAASAQPSSVIAYLPVVFSSLLLVLYVPFRFRVLLPNRLANLPTRSALKMKSIVTHLLLSWFVFLCPTEARSGELPPTVRHQLRLKAKHFERFRAAWRCQRELVTTKSSLSKSVDKQVNPGFWLESRFEYRFAKGCYYLSTYFYQSELTKDDWQFDKPKKRVRETAFDGNCLFTTKGRIVGKPPSFLHIRPLERMDKSQTFSELEVSLPRAAGLRVPESPADHGMSSCESLVLSVVDSKSAAVICQVTTFEGKEYFQIIVQDQGFESSFYLDPDMGYTLVRHEERDQSIGLQRVTVGMDFSMIAKKESWLPHRFEITHYTPPWPLEKEIQSEPVYVERVTLEAIHQEPTEESFQLNYAQCGLCVADERLYESVAPDVPIPYYVVSMQQPELDKLVERFGSNFSDATSRPTSPSVQLMFFVVITNLFFLVRLAWQRLNRRIDAHSLLASTTAFK